MDIRVFTTSAFRDDLPPELQERLIGMFKKYKATGIPPKDFGRDVPYDQIASIKATGLRHIHYRDSLAKHWHVKTLQFHKTSDEYDQQP